MSTFYRLLLLLYPADFRREYGDELREIFEERLRESSRLMAILGAIADVVPNALAVHLDVLKQDLRFAVRTLVRASGFTLTVIAIVALGIGANTAAFSLADFVLLRPLPYPDSDRLVRIWTGEAGYQSELVAIAVGRSLRALLFGVDPADPQTFALAIAICIVTAMVGSLRPALKAGLSDVVTALRE